NRRSFLREITAATTFLMSSRRRLFGADSPVIETSAGKIRGLVQGTSYTFKGVPYGASTAGAGRFMPPSKPQPWKDVKKTVDYGPRAPQIRAPGGGLVPEAAVMEWNGPMGEDCLVLNVWTPALKDTGKRPVMDWLHAGGYANGSAAFTSYDGHNLAQKHDVVVR